MTGKFKIKLNLKNLPHCWSSTDSLDSADFYHRLLSHWSQTSTYLHLESSTKENIHEFPIFCDDRKNQDRIKPVRFASLLEFNRFSSLCRLLPSTKCQILRHHRYPICDYLQVCPVVLKQESKLSVYKSAATQWLRIGCAIVKEGVEEAVVRLHSNPGTVIRAPRLQCQNDNHNHGFADLELRLNTPVSESPGRVLN